MLTRRHAFRIAPRALTVCRGRRRPSRLGSAMSAPLRSVSPRLPMAAPGRRMFSSSAKVLDAYSSALERWPLMTKALTSAALVGAGDVACQVAVEKKDAVDLGRFGRMALLGGVLIAPTLHVWYGQLSRIFPGTATVDVVKRVAVDQFLFAPAFIAARSPCVDKRPGFFSSPFLFIISFSAFLLIL